MRNHLELATHTIISVTHHNHLNLGTLTSMFLNDIVKKNNFRQLHSDVIFRPMCAQQRPMKLTQYTRVINTHVPDCVSETTDGRMHRGGTSIRVKISSSGLPWSMAIPSNGRSCECTHQTPYHTQQGNTNLVWYSLE